MNSYKLNGIAGHHFRQCVIEGLNIDSSDIYKVIESVDREGLIKTKDNKYYKLELKRVL